MPAKNPNIHVVGSVLSIERDGGAGVIVDQPVSPLFGEHYGVTLILHVGGGYEGFVYISYLHFEVAWEVVLCDSIHTLLSLIVHYIVASGCVLVADLIGDFHWPREAPRWRDTYGRARIHSNFDLAPLTLIYCVNGPGPLSDLNPTNAWWLDSPGEPHRKMGVQHHLVIVFARFAC